MKPFIKRILIFVLMVLAVNFILNRLLPLHIQDERYDVRYTYLKNNIDAYNTLFFGTSRTLRHVIPSVFDSLNANIGICTKSFNLGTPANKSFETYAQYEHFLGEYATFEKKNITIAFVEIAPLSNIAADNIFSRKSSYWVSYSYILRIFAYLQDRDFKFLSYAAHIKNYTLQYLIRDFGFNYFNPKIRNGKEDNLWLGQLRDGYVSYEDEILSTSDWVQKETLLNFKSEFLKDTMALEKMREKVKAEYSFYPDESSLNNGHLDVLEKLIYRSQEVGIMLIFVIHPRLSSYRELRAITSHFPERVIEISDPTSYPRLWTSTQSFNHSHLNRTASIYFTQMLSEEAFDYKSSSM